MQAFEFYCPTKIYFGKGAEARVGEAVKHFGGTKVFIVYGGHSAVKSGLIARIEQTLTDAGLEHMSFGGVQPNPRLSHAREGVQKALAFGADFILGVGGGSVMDTSKAIAHGVANPETDIWDFWSKKAALTKTSRLGAVLTISAAGSETSDSAVLTNDETTLKRGLNTDLQRPLFAIMDPELTYTLPRYQVGCGVVDIMMHTLERYFNPGHPSNRMTDEIAEGLLRTVIDAGRVAMQDSHNYDAMSEIMWAGSLSHNNLTGLGGVKDFSVHQFGHELSGMFDAAHGATLSVMWPQWARYVVDTDPARFAHYGEAVWRLTRKDGESDRDLALRAIDTTEEFFRSIDMPTTFTELGIGVLSEEQLRELAEQLTEHTERPILGMGISTVGVISSDASGIAYVTDFFGIRSLNLRDALQPYFRFPIIVCNDMHASGLCELYFGAGKDADSFLYMGITEGLGAALVSHHELLDACGELGHTSIDFGGPRCTCGSRGCLELYASAPAILSLIHDECGVELDSMEQAAGFAMTNKAAYTVFYNAMRQLSFGLNNYLNLVNVPLVVLGHDAAFLPEEFVRYLEQWVADINVSVHQQQLRPRFVKSRFGANSPIYGSACAVLQPLFQGSNLIERLFDCAQQE